MTPVIILAVSAIIAIILIKTADKPDKKPTTPSITLVSAQQVFPQDVTLNLASYGTVSPKYKTQLVSEVQGRIIKISPEFDSGIMVKKGQILAYIEPADYETDLNQAEAVLAQSIAALDEEIARGKVAKIEFKDFNNGLPPELGLRLPQLKKEQANVKYAQASVKRAKRNLDRTVIKAPFDGIIRSRNIELGEYVTKGTNFGELYGTQTAEIRLPISNSDLTYLESTSNPSAEVKLSTSLAGKNIIWTGKIVRSEGIIDSENRMIYLVAEINDPYQLQTQRPNDVTLKYGSFVNASITGKTIDGVVKLPRHLVRNGHIALVKSNNTIEIRKVNVVQTDIENVFIKDSLAKNELISLTPANQLTHGQKVKILNKKEFITTKEISPEQIAATGDNK